MYYNSKLIHYVIALFTLAILYLIIYCEQNYFFTAAISKIIGTNMYR